MTLDIEALRALAAEEEARWDTVQHGALVAIQEDDESREFWMIVDQARGEVMAMGIEDEDLATAIAAARTSGPAMAKGIRELCEEVERLRRLRSWDELPSTLPGGLMADHLRLDAMWQRLVTERDAALAESKRLAEEVERMRRFAGDCAETPCMYGGPGNTPCPLEDSDDQNEYCLPHRARRLLGGESVRSATTERDAALRKLAEVEAALANQLQVTVTARQAVADMVVQRDMWKQEHDDACKTKNALVIKLAEVEAERDTAMHAPLKEWNPPMKRWLADVLLKQASGVDGWAPVDSYRAIAERDAAIRERDALIEAVRKEAEHLEREGFDETAPRLRAIADRKGGK